MPGGCPAARCACRCRAATPPTRVAWWTRRLSPRPPPLPLRDAAGGWRAGRAGRAAERPSWRRTLPSRSAGCRRRQSVRNTFAERETHAANAAASGQVGAKTKRDRNTINIFQVRTLSRYRNWQCCRGRKYGNNYSICWIVRIHRRFSRDFGNAADS